MGINPDVLSMLKQMQERQEAGEIDDPQVEQALQAIDMAGRIVGTIMSGNQVDPVYMKNFIDNAKKKLDEAGEKPSKRSGVKKKKKFKVKVRS